MDLVPIPRDPQYPQITARLFATEEYADEPLDTYPSFAGYGPRTFEQWNEVFSQPSQRHELLAFLQVWLFFAPIKMLLDSKVTIQSLTRDCVASGDETTRVLSTSRLQEFMDGNEPRGIVPWNTGEWLDSYNTIMAAQYYFAFPNRHSNSSGGQAATLMQYLERGLDKDPRAPEESLICAILVEFFKGLIRPLVKGELPSILFKSQGRYPILQERMIKDGWCPSDVFSISVRMTLAGQYFISNMRPYGKDASSAIPNSIHQLDEAKQSVNPHQACTSLSCVLDTLSDTTYRRAHVCSNGTCEDVHVNRTALFKCLQKNIIPLIRIRQDPESGQYSLGIVPYDINTPYIAISHVWSQGLGNLNDNAIPKCQCQRLRDILSKLTRFSRGCALIWLDTLCVPPDPETTEDMQVLEAQKSAIRQMTLVYSKATFVLVLDSWLQAQSLDKSSNDFLATLLMITTSRWNTRLWTYQEGVIASKLVFLFSNMAIDPSKFAEAGHIRDKKITFWSMHTIATALAHTMSPFRMYKPAKRLVGAAESLSLRRTSVPEDEALCLAHVHGFDVDAILAQKSQKERMAAFWRMFDEVPLCILLIPGPRLNVAGLRWAPVSLLNTAALNGSPLQTSQGEVGKVTNEGLNVRSWGFLFHCSIYIQIGRKFWINHDDNIYQVSLFNIPESGTHAQHSEIAPSAMSSSRSAEDRAATQHQLKELEAQMRRRGHWDPIELSTRDYLTTQSHRDDDKDPQLSKDRRENPERVMYSPSDRLAFVSSRASHTQKDDRRVLEDIEAGTAESGALALLTRGWPSHKSGSAAANDPFVVQYICAANVNLVTSHEGSVFDAKMHANAIAIQRQLSFKYVLDPLMDQLLVSTILQESSPGFHRWLVG